MEFYLTLDGSMKCRISQNACGQCNRNVDNQKGLMHMETEHHRMRNFVFDFCQKPFGLRSALRIHISAVHEGVKNFVCSFCHKIL